MQQRWFESYAVLSASLTNLDVDDNGFLFESYAVLSASLTIHQFFRPIHFGLRVMLF